MVEVLTSELWAKGFVFLEGPRWHDGHLYASDMRDGAVLRLDVNGTSERVAEVPAWPSGLGFLPDGSMVVVGMHDRCVHRVTPEGMTVHADLSDFVTGPLNDMVVTPHGRCYVGDIGFDFYAGEKPAAGGITLIDTDGSARRVADGLASPNGMVVRPGGTSLVASESFANRVVEFDCDSDGNLSNRRVLIELADEVPDGMCLDVEGGIWLACYQGRRFIRIDPVGTITHEIPLKGANAVACQLGGADGRTLYCLTFTGTYQEMVEGIPASQIETVRVGIPGAGSP